MKLNFFQLLFKKEALVSNKKASVTPDLKLMTGKLKFFNKYIGYGLIETPEIPGRIFANISDLQQHLKVGSIVEFQLITTKKGYQAKKVKSLQIQQV